MSYILDALQKSETERQSQIAPETYRLSRPVETDPSSALRWLLLLCLLTLTVAGLSLLWQMWSPPSAVTEAIDFTPEPPAPKTAPAKAPEQTLEQNPKTVPEATPVPNIATATKTMQADPAPKSLAPASSPEPARTEAAPQPVLKPALVVPSESEAVAKQAEPTLADPVPPQQKKVVTMAELPASIRSSMPSLSFSFHVYASDPARRTIIINGRRLREGQSLNKDIRLINITPEGVVVAYRQHHIALPVINQW